MGKEVFMNVKGKMCAFGTGVDVTKNQPKEISSSTVINLERNAEEKLLEKSMNAIGNIAKAAIKQPTKGDKVEKSTKGQEKCINPFLPHNLPISADEPQLILKESEEIQAAAIEAKEESEKIYQKATNSQEKADACVYAQTGKTPRTLEAGHYEFEIYDSGVSIGKTQIRTNGLDLFYQTTIINRDDGCVDVINSDIEGIYAVSKSIDEYNTHGYNTVYYRTDGSVRRYGNSEFPSFGNYTVIYEYEKDRNGNDILQEARIVDKSYDVFSNVKSENYKRYYYNNGELQTVKLNEEVIYSVED